MTYICMKCKRLNNIHVSDNWKSIGPCELCDEYTILWEVPDYNPDPDHNYKIPKPTITNYSGPEMDYLNKDKVKK